MKALKGYLPLVCASALGLSALIGTANAANVTVTTVDDGVSNIGASGTLYWALTNANAGDTIVFAVPGTGPFYFKPPANGFPVIYQKHGLTIDGWSQSGSTSNTMPFTATNNAKPMIVIDMTNENYRDAWYVSYGSSASSGQQPVDPPIDNTAAFGDGSTTSTGIERAGFTPGTYTPGNPGAYVIGERGGLVLFRSRNVTIRGLAFIGGGILDDSRYFMVVICDFGGVTAILPRFDYVAGSCNGLHVYGCWFGMDPADGSSKGSDAAIALFRHRDRNGLANPAIRPDGNSNGGDFGEGIPNGVDFTIGVAPGSANARAEANVFQQVIYAIAGEGSRLRFAGNQCLSDSLLAIEMGRGQDSQSPSLIYGTDGDGVNDADEGNLFTVPITDYNQRQKTWVVAGNVWGIERDGTRLSNASGIAIDGVALDQGAMWQFGSNLDGVSDAEEANIAYDCAFSANGGGSANVNGSWFSMRGNQLINCITPPVADSAAAYWGKFMDYVGAGNTSRPVISGSTTTSLLVGTCDTNTPAYSEPIEIDLYESDPEGAAASDPQGKVYLGTFVDNGPDDTDPVLASFKFDISALPLVGALPSGTKITITANYKRKGQPTISSIAVGGGNVTLNITGGNRAYGVLKSSSVLGPYTLVALYAPTTSSLTFPSGSAPAFWRATGVKTAVQTSAFSQEFTLP